jgi:hypothetical protein
VASRCAEGTRRVTRRSAAAPPRAAHVAGLITGAPPAWATDLGFPVLVVNHSTAAVPGMQVMVGYLERLFPGVPVNYLDCGFPFPAVVS